MISLVDNHKSHLCLASYSLNDNGITQFTHAPTSHTIDLHLAKKLNLFYIDNTPKHRAWSMEQINRSFRDRLARNQILDLFDSKIIVDISRQQHTSEQQYPFEHLIWNRTYKDFLSRPLTHPLHSYTQRSVHGHDLNDQESDLKNIINLDNNFGKGLYEEECNNSIENPTLEYNEQLMTVHEIQKVEKTIIDFIKTDITQLLQKKQQSDINELLQKVDYYQLVLADPRFKDVYPLIELLINHTYLLKNNYLIANYKKASILSLLSGYIKEIETQINYLKQYKRSSEQLDSLNSKWNDQLRAIQKEHAIPPQLHKTLIECLNQIKQDKLDFKHLTPTLNQLIYLSTPSTTCIFNLPIIFNRVLTQSLDKEYVDIIGLLFYEQTEQLTDKLNVLIICAKKLNIGVKDEHLILFDKIIHNEEQIHREFLEHLWFVEFSDKVINHLINNIKENSFVYNIKILVSNAQFFAVSFNNSAESLNNNKERYLSPIHKQCSNEYALIEHKLSEDLTLEELRDAQSRLSILKKIVLQKNYCTPLENQLEERVKNLEDVKNLECELLEGCGDHNNNLQTVPDPSNSFIDRNTSLLSGIPQRLQISSDNTDNTGSLKESMNDSEQHAQRLNLVKELLPVNSTQQVPIKNKIYCFFKRTNTTDKAEANFDKSPRTLLNSE